MVPCPHCNEYQALTWPQLKWPKGKPNQVYYECCSCHQKIESHQKPTLLRKGRWQAQSESDGIAGFHINELYSPWTAWETMVKQFLAAKNDSERLKTWVNTALGEAWELQGEGVAYTRLMDRREQYGPIVPMNAVVLTAGADVQDDRIEIQVDAWGQGFEKWVMDYQVFWGCPGSPEVWAELDNYINQRFEHESGHHLNLASVFIDSGGHFTSEVYRYTKPRQYRRVNAIKGANVYGEPIVGIPKKQKSGVILYRIGTDTAKELLYARFNLDTPGPGYIHFHHKLPEGYFKQVTSEHVVTQNHKRIWKLRSGRRNEALDCSVYSLAAAESLRPNFDVLLNRLTSQPHDDEKPTPRATQNRYRAAAQRDTAQPFVAWTYA